MLRSYKDTHKAITQMLVSSYYKKQLAYVTRILKRSRLPVLNHSHWWLQILQAGLLNNLRHVQAAVAEGKKLEREAQDPIQAAKIKMQWQMNDHLSSTIQMVADGIAWRNLGYKRALLRLLAENDSPGPLNDHEIKTFKKILFGSKDLVLVNDLTRYLRVADLTCITKDGRVILLESKRSGDKIKNVGDILADIKKSSRPPNKQNQRHLIAQFAIIDKRITLPTFVGNVVRETTYDILDLDFSIVTHLQTVGRLLRSANRRGYAVAKLEPGYMVTVTAFDKLTGTHSETILAKYKKAVDEVRLQTFKSQTPKKLVISSYESLLKEGGHFARNMTPVSLLPFTDSDCAKIMLGYTKVDIHYDLEMVKTAFLQKGWQVKEDPLEEVMAPPDGKVDLGKYGPRSKESFMTVSRSVDGAIYYSKIPITQVMIMLTSFYGTSFLVDAAESQFMNSQKDRNNRAVVLNYSGEGKVLR